MPPVDRLNDLVDLVDEPVTDVIEEISPEDQMFQSEPEYYFDAGRFALRCIRIAMMGARKTQVDRILDLPSGHGRVLRTLKAAFPEAELAACDINRDGVDFCARAFGAIPVYGQERAAEIDITGPFDLIWCGSLLTHLDRQGCRDFLDLFESLLAPGNGLLVFTTHGRMVVDRIRARLVAFGMKRPDVLERFGALPGYLAWNLKQDRIEKLLADYESEGFGYAEWFDEERRRMLQMPTNYGISVSSPAWVCREIEQRRLRAVSYQEGGWGRQMDWWSQDAVGVLRPED